MLSRRGFIKTVAAVVALPLVERLASAEPRRLEFAEILPAGTWTRHYPVVLKRMPDYQIVAHTMVCQNVAGWDWPQSPNCSLL